MISDEQEIDEEEKAREKEGEEGEDGGTAADVHAHHYFFV